jgi:protein-S-isoprenylcysteine O-methyltransferase Ste14
MVRLAKLVKRRNLPFRMLFVAAICVPAAFPETFCAHFRAYLTGNVLDDIIWRQWHIVVLSILLFLACLVPLSFRRNVQWAEYGLVTAFFVSLFVEMYGIPFTILLAHKWFYQATIVHPTSVIDFHLLGVHFRMDLPMVYAAVLMTVGALLVVVGWVTLYFGVKTKSLVTNGVYACSRHPQYLGFIMIVGGWLIGWPTMLTMVLAPILILVYVRTARHEENEVPDLAQYRSYREMVPFLI